MLTCRNEMETNQNLKDLLFSLNQLSAELFAEFEEREEYENERGFDNTVSMALADADEKVAEAVRILELIVEKKFDRLEQIYS